MLYIINKRYSEFRPTAESAENLMEQVADVSKDIDLLKSCIENDVRTTFYSSVHKFHLAASFIFRLVQ